jgi:GTP-binding protein
LERYNPEMLDKSRLVAISKTDLLDEELESMLKEEVRETFKDVPVHFISSVAQQGLQPLKDALWEIISPDKNAE